MSVSRHPGTIGFGPNTTYPRSIRVLREMLEVETDPRERKVLEARLEERRAHSRARKRKLRARRLAEESR